MRLRAALTTLLLLPASAFAIAATAPDGCTTLVAGGDGPEDDVLACPTTMYLGGCEDYEAGKVYQPLIHTTSVPLVAEKPEASFTAGAGCGTTDEPAGSGTTQDTAFSFDVSGRFPSVNPDTMTIELHDIVVGSVRASGVQNLDVRISVQGEFPLGTEENESVDGTVSKSPATVRIPVESVRSSTGISEGYTFTVTNLSEVLTDARYAAGTGPRASVIVTIDLPFPPDGAHAFVWGASEVPASVSFNIGEQGTVVDALDHVVD